MQGRSIQESEGSSLGSIVAIFLCVDEAFIAGRGFRRENHNKDLDQSSRPVFRKFTLKYCKD